MNTFPALHRPIFLPLSGYSEQSVGAYLTTPESTHIQIGAGQLGGEIAFMPLHHGSLRLVHFTLDMRFAATTPDDQINFVYSVSVPTETRFCGVPVKQGSMLAIDQGTYTDSRLGAGVTWIGFRFPRSDLVRTWQGLTEREMPWDQGVMRSLPANDTGLVLSDTLAEIQTIARQHPMLFDRPVWRRNVEAALRETYARAFLSETDTTAADRAPLRASYIVRKVDTYLETSDELSLTVSDLCRTLGIHRRTMERAFADMIGIGPKSYLQLRALTKVRDALLDPQQLAAPITSLAMQFGFWHLGRFSHFYRSLFGEAPSETRRRTFAYLGRSAR